MIGSITDMAVPTYRKDRTSRPLVFPCKPVMHKIRDEKWQWWERISTLISFICTAQYAGNDFVLRVALTASVAVFNCVPC